MVLRFKIKLWLLAYRLGDDIVGFARTDRNVISRYVRNLFEQCHEAFIHRAEQRFGLGNLVFDLAAAFQLFLGRVTALERLRQLIAFCPQRLNLSLQSAAVSINLQQIAYAYLHLFLSRFFLDQVGIVPYELDV